MAFPYKSVNLTSLRTLQHPKPNDPVVFTFEAVVGGDWEVVSEIINSYPEDTLQFMFWTRFLEPNEIPYSIDKIPSFLKDVLEISEDGLRQEIAKPEKDVSPEIPYNNPTLKLSSFEDIDSEDEGDNAQED